ncbi:MAG: beta-lactamase family protein [Bifidobacteriaceae bacterium]|nr:beta-lactamase family protein [Bifidobacteriaceae bacterium]
MREDDFKSIVTEAREAFAAPSVSAAVQVGDQIWRHAVGDRGLTGGAVDADTVYPVASVSKAFMAACVMMLVDEGRLELDAPVKRHLPELELWTKELTEQLTVRDMLTHRSGLPRHDVTSFTRPDATLAQTVAYLRWLEPRWGLRERFGYQNHMFALASYLVERVSGEPWSAVVRQRIFAPLGLTRAYTAWGEYKSRDDNYARLLITRGSTAEPIDQLSTDSMACAASLSMSVRDLLRWGSANLALHALDGIGGPRGADGGGGIGGGPGGRGGVLALSAAATRELHSAQMPIRPGEAVPYQEPLVEDNAYGLGWFVERHRGAPLVHHGGTLRGVKSLVGFMPEHGLALAVLVNQNDSPVPSLILRQVVDAALGADPYDWRGFYLGLRDERQAKTALEYREAMAPGGGTFEPACAGDYEHPAYGRMRIADQPDGPRLSTGGESYRLRAGAKAPWVIDADDVSQALPCYFDYADAADAADAAGSADAADAADPAGPPAASVGPARARAAVPAAFCAWLEPELDHPIRFERLSSSGLD